VWAINHIKRFWRNLHPVFKVVFIVLAIWLLIIYLPFFIWDLADFIQKFE